MSNSVIPHPEQPNVYIDGFNKPVVSAWIVVTYEERHVYLPTRICFPHRICLSIGKPISPTTTYESELFRTASCALEIGGKLYVISSMVEKIASSADGTRNGNVWDDSSQQRIGQDILDSVRLGRVVFQAPESSFVVIEVADNFRVCQHRTCPRCLGPLDSNWLATRDTPNWNEDANILTLDGRLSEMQELKTTHFIKLRCNVSSPDSNEPIEADSGSLVMHNEHYIGIAYELKRAEEFGQVLLFDDKLWAFFARCSDSFPHLKEMTGPLTVTNVWKHLEHIVGKGAEKTETREIFRR
ncbi:hypothetical protein F5Y12DRAFT_788594 [Xylaria sp. FL1777]|nr:hypothetical protein F5Y12DRAFT_788594 [Xylaria sp. FL1777]